MTTIIILIILLVISIAGLVFLFWSVIKDKKKKEIEQQEKWQSLSDEERATIEAERQKAKEEQAKKTAIAKTRIIGQDTRKSASSSVARGVVGGALFGVAGAVGGAMSGKNKQQMMFYVTYKDGHSETKTVSVDSVEFKVYMAYLEK